MAVPVDNFGQAQNVRIVDAAGADVTIGGGSSSATLNSGAKGTSPSFPITGTSVDANHNGLDVVEQFAPTAEDNANGVIAVVQKLLSTGTYCPTVFSSRGAANTANVKPSPGNLYGLTCTITSTATRFLQFFNSTAATTGSPLLEFAIPAGGTIYVGSDILTSNGIRFSTGITFGFSTTSNTFTGGTAAEQSTQVFYL